MKSKLLFTVLLTLILAITLVNATVSFTSTTPAALTKINTQTSFIVTNQGSDAVNIEITLPSTITDGKGHSISITSQSALVYSNIATSQSTGAINLVYSGDTTSFNIGQYSSNIVIKATSIVNSSNFVVQTVPLKFMTDFCKYGQNGTDISISSIDINNEDGDDTEWSPLDQITIKVEVENNGDEKVSSLYTEIGLIDSAGKNIVGDLEELSDKKIDVGSLSDGKSKTVEFKFKVPSDFKDENYLLVVKTYKSGKEAAICSSYSSDLESGYYQTISGVREDEEKRQVVLNNIKTSPEDTVACGEKVQVTADVYNIGDQDYEDQIKVTLYNKELKLDLEQVLRGDLNQGDSDTVDFEFDVPKNAAEKIYTLQFRTYYDFNSGDSYDITSEETFTKSLRISGNCQISDTKPALQIAAELDSETPEAIAGKQVIVKTTLKNTGTTDSTYTISAYGNSAWSSLVSIEPESISLKAGETKTLSIILNVDKEAQGDQEFTIKATSGASSLEQRVALTISKSNTQLSSISDHFKKNWFIYIIVLVNLVLIIAIIIVIKRMVSPRKRRDFE